MKECTWKNKIQIIISCIVIVLIWQIIAIKVDNNIYIPKIQDIVSSMLDIMKDKDFLKNLFSSLSRTIISFSLALIFSIVLGVLAFMYPFLGNFFKPLNAIGKTIPTMVLVVLALIWFDKSKAPFIVGFFIVFPILYDGVITSITQVDNEYESMCKVYNVSKIQKLKKLYIPKIAFYLVGILISTFSLAFKVVIAGEVHGQPTFGIGSAIQISKMNFDTNAIFAWIFIIAIMSVVLEFLNKLIVKKVYRWKDEYRN